MKRKRGELSYGRLLAYSIVLGILVLIALLIAFIPASLYAPDLYVISELVPLYHTQLLRVLDTGTLTPACPIDVADDGRVFLTTDPKLAEHC